MKLVIILNAPLFPPPKISIEGRKSRIEEVKQTNQPVFDRIEKKLSEMQISFKSRIMIATIILEDQLSIIKSWKEVKTVCNGDTPINLIRPVNN